MTPRSNPPKTRDTVQGILRRFASIAMIAVAMRRQTKNSMPELGVISETPHLAHVRIR